MPEFGHFFCCSRLFVNFRLLFIYLFILFSFTPNDNEIKFKAKVRKNKETLPVASLIISLKATKR